MVWALYVEHAWVPGADEVVRTPGKGLDSQALGRYNAARLAARRLMDHLFPADEPVSVDG